MLISLFFFPSSLFVVWARMASKESQALCGVIPVSLLDCLEPFSLLTKKEKLYTHFLSKASWAGAPICLTQTSKESPAIYALFLELFASISFDDLKAKSIESAVSSEEWDFFAHYISNFFGNMGNYLSFGDTKFIPQITKEKIEKIMLLSENSKAISQYDEIKESMFSLKEHEIALQIPPKGVSTYYSENINESDIKFVQGFLQKEMISAYNTRLFKIKENTYEVHLAAAIRNEGKKYAYQGASITVICGDHQKEMVAMVTNLRKALPYAANDYQRDMLLCYISSFENGSIDDHKDAQRHWIKDKGPVVESNMGFIESYRDPFGVRGEFESFVSIVDKKASERLVILVDNAENFLKLLPWEKTFAKDSFSRPDFTSLCVVTFASSGIPAGINIPNYDDIRETEGFKNVSLGNVLSAASKTKPIPFLDEEDEKMMKEMKGPAFEVQVALHELLGHGSGRMLTENEKGEFNFDKLNALHPFTKDVFTSWYKPGQTYDSVFTSLSSAMEECRAECVGLYLSVVPEILALFDVQAEKETCCDITYVNWLLLVHGGLRGLEFYSPDTNNWRQAHMQARHAIMRVLLEKEVVLIKQSEGNAEITIVREKLLSHGVPAIGDFLNKIMVFQATADLDSAVALFDKYTGVSDEFLTLRDIVIAKKQPRQVFVQVNTVEKDGEVTLASYEPSAKGIVDSFLARQDA